MKTRLARLGITTALCCAFSASLHAVIVEQAKDGLGTFISKTNGIGSYVEVTSPVRAGTKALTVSAQGSPRRSEIDAGSFDDPVGNYWYGMSYFIPNDAAWSGNFFQYMGQLRWSNLQESGYSVPNASQNSGIGYYHGGSGTHIIYENGRWIFELAYQDPSSKSAEGMRFKIFDLGPATKGVWTDFVYEANWSHRAEIGSFKAWKRENGGTYTKVAEYYGITWLDTYAAGSAKAGQKVGAPNFTVGLYATDSGTATRTLTVDEIATSNSSGLRGFYEVAPGGYTGTIDYGNKPTTFDPAVVVTEAEGNYCKRFTNSSTNAALVITADSAASEGSHLVVNGLSSAAAGRLDIAVLPGSYTLSYTYKSGPDRGQVQVDISGVLYGSVIDQYSATPSFQTVNLGTWTPATQGIYALSFRVKGKNAASSGYTFSIDALRTKDNAYSVQTRPALFGDTLELEYNHFGKYTSGPVIDILNDAAASNGQHIVLSATTDGPGMRINLPYVPPGTYPVKIRYKSGSNRAKVRASLNNVNIGADFDQYSASSGYVVANLGNVTFPATANGTQDLRFYTSGKNASSSSYTISVDYVQIDGIFPNVPSSISATNLVGYYKLEQNGTDSSSAANNATTAGGTVAYSTNAFEGSYSASFNGTGSRLIAPDSTSLRITGPLTLACFVNPSSWTVQPNLIAKSFNSGYRLRITNTGKLNLILGKDAAGNAVNVSSTGSLTANTWQHVAATVGFSGGTATIKFYINGVLDSTSTATLSAIYGGTGVLSLGTRDNSTAESLNGLLDEVLIYSRELTAAQIAALL
jgi:hypothetical protein